MLGTRVTPTVNDILANDSAIRMMASSCLTVTGTGGASVSSRVDELRACRSMTEVGRGGKRGEEELDGDQGFGKGEAKGRTR